ncbi:unnamed protein product [Brassica rapa subsp. trilocularis]
MLLSIYYRFQQHHIFTVKKGEDEHGDLNSILMIAAIFKGRWNLTRQWRRLMMKLRDDGSK